MWQRPRSFRPHHKHYRSSLFKFFYQGHWMIFQTVAERWKDVGMRRNGMAASPPSRGCLWQFESRFNGLDEEALQLIRQNGYFTLVLMHELRRPIEYLSPRPKHSTTYHRHPLRHSALANILTIFELTWASSRASTYSSFIYRHLRSSTTIFCHLLGDNFISSKFPRRKRQKYMKWKARCYW